MGPAHDLPDDATAGADRRLRIVVDRLPAMVAYWDADLRNVVANEAYREWFGFSPDAMRGIHIREVLGEEVFAKNLPHIEAVLRGHEQLFERTLVDTAGRIRHTQASYVPDVVAGVVVGFSVLVTDVTPRVEAERTLRQGVGLYRALARSVPDSFVVAIDVDQRVVVADGALLDAFAPAAAWTRCRQLRDVLDATATELVDRCARALAGETSRWDHRVGARTFALTAGPVRGGGGAVFAGMLFGSDVTDQRRREAIDRALRAIAGVVARGGSSDEVFGLVSTSLLEIFDTRHAGVARFDANGLAELLTVEPGIPGLDDELPLIGRDETTAVGSLARTGAPAFVRYAPGSPGVAGRLASLGIQAAAAAPILVNGRLWGAVVLAPRADIDGDKLLADLVEFADVVALSISSAEAWDALANLAARDSLTGLVNRRTFDELLASALRGAARSGEPVSVAIVDLDHFKQVNDGHGHLAGDRVLREAAQRMLAATRAEEVLARLGGEEFGLLLPGADAAAGRAAADRVRAALAHAPVAGHVVTASAGVGTVEGGADAELLMAAADRALYDAKRAGRDRTAVATA